MNPLHRLALACAASVACQAFAAEPKAPQPASASTLPPPSATEAWTPVPPVIAAPAGGIPSDAIVLFDGKNLDAWELAKSPGTAAPWKIEGDALVVVPRSGHIRTKASFGDVQLHLEFRTPAEVKGSGQGRGNSGIFFHGVDRDPDIGGPGLYELQILDSHENQTYANGQAGSIYKQHPPFVNASRPPGEWQSYDIIWIAPRFAADGKLVSPARMTVFHNGVLVQHAAELKGPTAHRGTPPYKAHPAKGPIMLQDHNNLTAFRNIWVRELMPPDASKSSVADARVALEAMHETDQVHRREIIELEKKHGRNSPEVQAAWAKQNAIDGENIRSLEKIIAQHGWPGSTQFGRKAAGAAFLILQHSDLAYQKQYLPLARVAAANGEMRPSSLALLEDRVRLREGQKQIYGSQVTRNDADEWEPRPLEDEARVDGLRAAVGLGPLSEYLQGFADRSGGRVASKWKKSARDVAAESETSMATPVPLPEARP